MSTVPVFSPDGELGDIPYERMHDAIAAGGKIGVNIKSPDGKLGTVPADRYPDAVKAGATVVPFNLDTGNHDGNFLSTLGNDLKNMVTNPPEIRSPYPGVDQDSKSQLSGELGEASRARTATRKAEGYSGTYRALAPVAETLGVNVGGMEDAAKQGDSGAVLGHAAAVPTAMAITAGVAKGTKAVGAAFPEKAPLAPDMAAREITKAINPSVNEYPSFIKANSTEAGNILNYAKQNNIPIKTQLDYAKAARGLADQAKQLYQNHVLNPYAKDVVSVNGANFRGTTVGEGENATLGSINKRIGDINDELRSAYQKKEQGQTMSALASDADLKAEQSALTDILHKELSKRTGLEPQNIATLRQRFGKNYSIADQTEAAINQRQSSASKAAEGRRDVPLTATGAALDVINKVRGGSEGIANRALLKALGKAGTIQPTALPPVTPPLSSPLPSRVPFYLRGKVAP